MKKILEIIKNIMTITGGLFFFLATGAADIKSLCWAMGLGLILVAPTVIESYIEMKVEDKIAEREME